MNILFEKLDQLSNPLGFLLDAAMNRLVPHTTASACGAKVLCRITCSGKCGSIGNPLKTLIYAPSQADCNNGTHLVRCPSGCC